MAPLDVRIVPIADQPNELMLYPLQNEMKDYEIVLAHINPIPEIFQEENGFFAGLLAKNVCASHIRKLPE